MADNPKSNPYELAGREKKAAALIDALYQRGLQNLASHLDDAQWAVVARDAGVKPPSPETIALVKHHLAARKGGTQ